jgi:prepilin-type N-terminal cleavage/methylation domain-containing protein
MNGKCRDRTPAVLVQRNNFDQRGFTLVELVIVIVVLGILAAVAIPMFAGVSESSRTTATLKEMQELKRAIVGSPEMVSGGRPIQRGFEGDIGHVPNRLVDLVVRPDSIAPYDRLIRLGWNGPYIDSSGGRFLADAWGAAYLYDPWTRRLLSVGGSDTLRESF